MVATLLEVQVPTSDGMATAVGFVGDNGDDPLCSNPAQPVASAAHRRAVGEHSQWTVDDKTGVRLPDPFQRRREIRDIV